MQWYVSSNSVVFIAQHRDMCHIIWWDVLRNKETCVTWYTVIRVTSYTDMCHRTQCYMSRNMVRCVTSYSGMCHMTRPLHAPLARRILTTRPPHVPASWLIEKEFCWSKCITCLTIICVCVESWDDLEYDCTHSCLCRDSYVWCDSFTCMASDLTHACTLSQCDMTHS